MEAFINTAVDIIFKIDAKYVEKSVAAMMLWMVNEISVRLRQ